jgi:hypothetical protein
MKIEINNIEELSSLLGKAYWMESQLELVGQWEAYMVAKKDKYRDILFRISHDSEGHKILLRRIASNIEDLDLEKALEKQKEKKFDFRRLHDEEIIAELLKNEMIVLDIYEKLKSFTGKEFIERIWKGTRAQDFYEDLNWLIAQERAHVGLLKPFAGRIERIY